MTRRPLLAATLIVALAGCGNDDGGPITGDGGTDGGVIPCDPIPSTYTSIYANILNTDGCARAACHDTATTATGGSGRLDLSVDKDMVYTALLVDPTDAMDVRAQLPNRVVAGDLMQSFLWRKVADEDPPGFGARMPQGCSPRFPQVCLTNCQMDALSAWITAGAMDD